MGSLNSGFSRELLERIYAAGKQHGSVFWRHDVDFSLDAALKMARFEAKRGVSSTYYLFLSSKNPFYSPVNAKTVGFELSRLGHTVGDHVDEREIRNRTYSGPISKLKYPPGWLVSFHCPTAAVLWKDFEGFEHALAAKWKNRYSSDSNGQFRTDPITLLNEVKESVQINLHPEWWFEPGWYHDIDEQLYEAFFYGEKPIFTDSRRGRAVRRGQPAVWAFDPRANSAHCALWVSLDDYDAVMKRGYALIDDQKAIPFMSDCDRDLGFLRLTFASGGYVRPEGTQEPPDVMEIKQ